MGTSSAQNSLAIFVLLAALINPTHGVAEEQLVVVENESMAANASGTCGIYALIAAADALGTDVDINKLLVPKFAGSLLGSSVHELQAAAESVGLQANHYAGLSWVSLQALDSPCLLLLDDVAGGGPHWVTYLGKEQGLVRVFDQAHADRVVAMPVGDLVSNWTGVGLSISIHNSGFAGSSVGLVPALRFVLLIGIGLVLGRISVLIGRDSRIRCVCCFLGSILVLAGTIAATDESQAVWNQHLASWFSASLSQENDQIPVIGFQEFETIYLGGDGAYMIDARPYDAFRQGSLKGSLNVPVNAASFEFFNAINGMDRGKKCVVFCASSECTWASVVANRLYLAGFRDVSVFRGGIQVLGVNGYRPG